MAKLTSEQGSLPFFGTSSGFSSSYIDLIENNFKPSFDLSSRRIKDVLTQLNVYIDSNDTQNDFVYLLIQSLRVQDRIISND